MAEQPDAVQRREPTGAPAPERALRDASASPSDGAPSAGPAPHREPPARPPIAASAAPAPIRPPTAVPKSVKRIAAIWTIAGVAGFLTVLVAFLFRGSGLSGLETAILEAGPATEPQRVSVVAGILFWGSIIMQVVVVVLEVLAGLALTHGRGRVRWTVLPVLLLHVVTLVLVTAFLGGTDAGEVPPLLCAAGLLVALIATLAGYLPPAGRWFRAQREVRKQRA